MCTLPISAYNPYQIVVQPRQYSPTDAKSVMQPIEQYIMGYAVKGSWQVKEHEGDILKICMGGTVHVMLVGG